MKLQNVSRYLALGVLGLCVSAAQAASLCDTDTDCQWTNSVVPDCIDGVCQKACTADGDCSGANVCDVNVCRQSCQTSSECGDDLPICINSFCRECDSDGQCWNVGACYESNCRGVCVDNHCKSCNSNTDCTHEFWSFCSDNQCRNCLTDDQCPRNLGDSWVNGDLCVQYVCRECASDNDCIASAEGRYCDTEGSIYQNFVCRECTEDSHCDPRPCYAHHCGCLDDDECPVNHHCETSGACKCSLSCCDNYDCYNPNEICLGNECVCPDGENCSQHQESWCFSASAMVQLPNEQKKAMRDLQVGDHVLTGKVSGELHYEPVYAFGHWDPVQTLKFLRISTSSGPASIHPLEVSSDHLVFVQGKEHPVPASSIKMRDVLCGVDSCAQSVVRITTIHRNDGVYAPLTPSGKIVVDGIRVSNYIGLQKGSDEYPVLSNGVTIPISKHWFIHGWLTPFRMVCMMGITPALCGIPTGQDKPMWVNWGLELARYVDNQSITYQLIILSVALVIFVPLYCLEVMSVSVQRRLLVPIGLGLWAIISRGCDARKIQPSKKHV